MGLKKLPKATTVKSQRRYVLGGSRWRWGMHRHEAPTLLTIIGVAVGLGLVLTIVIVGWIIANFAPPFWVMLLLSFAIFCGAYYVTLAVARAVIGPVWAFITTRDSG